MSSTSQFTTFSDLYQGLLKAIRSDRGNSATVEDAKRYINTALLDMHIGFSEKVPWALRDHTFTTTEAATLTVSARNTTSGSNENGVPTRNYGFGIGTVGLLAIGAKLHITASSIPSSVGLETEIAGGISTSFETGEATANVYSNSLSVDDVLLTYQNDIELPDDFMRIASSTVRLGTRQLPVIGRIEFRHRFAGDTSLGRPMHTTMIDSTDIALGLDNRKLRLHPIPNVVERGHLTYVTNLLAVTSAGVWQRDLQADTDTPIVPLRYRHAIFFHALYNWYRDKKDDVRSQEAKAEYVEIMNRITNDTEAGQSNMSIRPVINQYRGKAKRPYNRRGGRRMDFGRFDRMYD